MSRNDSEINVIARCEMETKQDLFRLSLQRFHKTSSDSSDDEAAAFTDGPLVDTEWTARYQERMKAKEDLERNLKDRLRGNTEIKK